MCSLIAKTRFVRHRGSDDKQCTARSNDPVSPRDVLLLPSPVQKSASIRIRLRSLESYHTAVARETEVNSRYRLAHGTYSSECLNASLIRGLTDAISGPSVETNQVSRCHGDAAAHVVYVMTSLRSVNCAPTSTRSLRSCR